MSIAAVMRVTLITPANRQSRGGNRTTAARWARLLRALGHRVDVALEWDGGAADVMVALHAWRSAAAITAFRDRHRDRALIVGLAGTDIYRFIDSDRATVLGSLDRADALVGLHDLVADAIPARYHAKLTVIHQSAAPLARAVPLKGAFEVAVIGHLREEKDPLRAAAAARALPASSRVRISHLGRAHAPHWAEAARAEMAANPRYRWLGDVPGARVRRVMARARLMVLSSVMEGGANVVSEALVAGLPVLASAIPGSIGLLGADHPGYFPVGDTAALTALLARAETDPDFIEALARHGATRAPLFTETRERAAWQALLARLGDSP
jgi:putative glycosyltransferase (TIGR04348 family)